MKLKKSLSHLEKQRREIYGKEMIPQKMLNQNPKKKILGESFVHNSDKYRFESY